MIQEIGDNIPNTIENKCISELNEKHNFLLDTENGVLIVNATDFYHLYVEKTNKTVVYSIQNDNCVMINSEGGQCDLLILNEEKLYFVEIKGTQDNRSNHRKTAYKQIENTFKYYSNYIEFPKDYKLNALVCFKHKRRIVQASASTKKKEFKVKYNINLEEGNYINFD
ncbi:hypothetical protein [Algibacter sp. 2305UL17-15]|uniref:hypothetical protein n=1 Tax=Algibacter sp. 2305UL17-15 TaxID=3231268 RepID=UPI00345787F6